MANSAVVGILKAILSLDTAEFINGIRQSSNAMGAWTKDLKDMSRQAQNIGTSLSKVLTLPIVAVGTAASKAAIDFESSFAGVGKTVDGVMDSGGQLTDFGKSLQQSFRDLAKQIPININDLNRVGEAAGALGIKKDDIKEFTRVMSLLGVTTNLTADDAAAGIAKIQNIFGEAGKETDRFGAALVDLGNNGASTESQILDMATRIAGAGHTVGMTQAEVLGVANALASVGLEAEAGGTAISRVLVNMAASVSAGGKKLEEFASVAGMTADQFATKFKTDAAGALVAFVQGLGNVKQSGGDLFATLQNLGLSQIRVRDTMLRVAGAGDLLADSVKMGTAAWQKNTAMTDEANKRFQTTASQLQLLWNRITDVGITLGQALLPAVRSVVSAAGAFLPMLDTFAHGFAGLPGPIQLGVIAILGITAAAGPAIYAMGQLAQAAGNLTGLFSKNGLATRALAGDATVLTGTLKGLGSTVAVVGTAFAAWELGKWLDQFRTFHDVMANLVPPIAMIDNAQRNANAAQRQLIDTIKAETIARAEQKGAVLQSTDVTKRYLEAVKYLQDVETARRGAMSQSIEQQKAAIEANLRLGKITQDQANAQLAALGVEQQVAEVRRKRISITDVATNSEKQVNEEIKATGYTMSQLTDELSKNKDDFMEWAKQSGLSQQTIKAVEQALKDRTKAHKEEATAVKDAAQVEREYQETIQHTYSVLKSMGITTTDMVLRSMGELQEAFSIMIAQGVPMDRAFGTILPKLISLADETKRSGLNVDALNEFLRETQGVVAATAPSLSGLVRAFDPMQSIAGVKAVSFEMTKLQDDTRRATDAFHFFGLKTPEEMAEASRAARQHFDDLRSTVGVTAEQLEAAWEDVLKAEGNTRKNALSYWKDWARQVEQIGRDLAKQFAATLLGIRGQTAQAHQEAADDAKKSYDDTVAESKQTLAQAQQDARDQYDQTTQSVKGNYEDQLASAQDSYNQQLDSLQDQLDAGLITSEDAAQARKNLENWLAGEQFKIQTESQTNLEAADKTYNDTITAAAQKSHDDIAASQAAMQQAIEDASHPFRDNMIDLWHSIRDAFKDVMSQMLGDFIEIFIKGSLAALAGNKGAFSSLLSSMFSGIGIPGGAAPSIVSTLPGTAVGLNGAPIAGGTAGAGNAVGTFLSNYVAPAYAVLEFGNLLNGTGLFGQNSFDERDRDAMIDALGLGQYGYQYSTDQLEEMLNAQGLSFEKGTNGSYVDFGSGTLAMLHGHEKITPYGDSESGGTVQLNIDGVRLAEALIPAWPRAKARYHLA